MVALSYEDFGERVGASTGNVRLRGVECDIVDCFVALLTMRRNLLNTCLPVQIPQADRTVVTSRQKVQAVGINRQTCDSFQMCYHRMHHFACVIVKEADVPVFVGSDSERQGRVTDHAVHLSRDSRLQ
ncbi:hypothetical protein NP493_382g01010 [Ridgeia piscesae]|uniref:Uncharacterized protein n=1 Tax=Ridgeia piscesae TaxID=27915 RepID=A0AAD9L2H7_RIDPI|nr:hypothetical protein NP493_382g01010 [Ridgeia piscesae]